MRGGNTHCVIWLETAIVNLCLSSAYTSLYSSSFSKITSAITAQMWFFWLPEGLGSLMAGLQDFFNSLKSIQQSAGWVLRNCTRASMWSNSWVSHLTLNLAAGVVEVVAGAAAESVVSLMNSGWVVLNTGTSPLPRPFILQVVLTLPLLVCGGLCTALHKVLLVLIRALIRSEHRTCGHCAGILHMQHEGCISDPAWACQTFCRFWKKFVKLTHVFRAAHITKSGRTCFL